MLLAVVALSSPNVFAAEKIDINTAPLEELIKIIHIGETRASQLISLRPFSTLDELTKIKGLSEARVNDIKSQGLAWVAQKQGLPSGSSPDPAQNQTMKRVDINTAPLKELVKIIHIGEARAMDLISLRPFFSLRELTRIKGIGKKSIEDIKKQGLAWLDPGLAKEIKTYEENFSYSNNQASDQQANVPSFVLIISLGQAVFSSMAILTLKKFA